MPEADGVVFSFENSPMLELPDGLFRDSFMVTDRTGEGKRLSAGLGWFAPGHDASHAFTHGFDEAFYVIRGTATYLANGLPFRVAAGNVVYCPAGTAHTFVTDGGGLQIFWCIAAAWEDMDPAIKTAIATTWKAVDQNSGWHLDMQTGTEVGERHG